MGIFKFLFRKNNYLTFIPKREWSYKKQNKNNKKKTGKLWFETYSDEIHDKTRLFSNGCCQKPKLPAAP